MLFNNEYFFVLKFNFQVLTDYFNMKYYHFSSVAKKRLFWFFETLASCVSKNQMCRLRMDFLLFYGIRDSLRLIVRLAKIGFKNVP